MTLKLMSQRDTKLIMIGDIIRYHDTVALVINIDEFPTPNFRDHRSWTILCGDELHVLRPIELRMDCERI